MYSSNLNRVPVILVYEAKGHPVVRIDIQEEADLKNLARCLADFISRSSQRMELLREVPSLMPIRIRTFVINKGGSALHKIALNGDDKNGYDLHWSEPTSEWGWKLQLINSMAASEQASHQYLNEPHHGEAEVIVAYRERRPDLKKFL